jgi:hypothetical protein
MSDRLTIAKELRELSREIEEVVRRSRVSSIANEQVRAFCDYLCLRARVIELEDERPASDAA